MGLPRRQFLRVAAGAVALPLIPGVARAQIYPSRPVRVVVTFAAGGPNDIIGRLMSILVSPSSSRTGRVPPAISAPRRSYARPRTDTRSSWKARTT